MEASTTHIANVSLLSSKLAKYAWMNTFWANLAGFQKITQTNKIKQYEPHTNAVVQVVKDFVDEGRDTLMMALLMPLVEDVVYGDTWLKGTGEDLSLRYMELYINQARKAVTKLSGRGSNQRLKTFRLMEQAQPELIKYWSKWFNSALFRTMYEGVSPQLSAGTANEGLGVNVRWHPNMYSHKTQDTGALTACGTEKNIPTYSQISSMINADHYKISAAMLAELNIIAKTVMLIEPILYQDAECYMMLVTPDGMKQAKQDSTIVAAQNSAYMRELGKHPAIRGRDYLFFDGICLIEERIGCRTLPKAAVGSGAAFDAALAGTNGWLNPPARQAIQSNILLGRDAIGLGIADNLHYTEETDDHGNVIEIGSYCIQGANRVDYVDDTVKASVFVKNNSTKTYYNTDTACVNQSSAIIFTGLN